MYNMAHFTMPNHYSPSYSTLTDVVDRFNSKKLPTSTTYKTRYELIEGYPYRLKELCVSATKYGETLCAELFEADAANTSGDLTFKVFLPKRFKESLKDAGDINIINSSIGELVMTFKHIYDKTEFFCTLRKIN